MELIVHLAQAFPSNVGVDFGGADAGVTKELLDAKIGAAFRRWVAKLCRSMCGVTLRVIGAHHAGLDPADRAGRKGGATLGEKHIGRGSRLHENRSTGLEILLHRRHSRAAQRHDAFLVAFADDGDKAVGQMQLFQPQVAQFAQAAGCVGQLQNSGGAQLAGSVGAGACRCPDRITPWAGVSSGGQGEIFRDVGADNLFGGRVFIKRAEGGDLQVNRFRAELFGLFALPFGRTIAFVLEEFREMFVDVFPIAKTSGIGPVNKTAKQRGIGLLRLGGLPLFGQMCCRKSSTAAFTEPDR